MAFYQKAIELDEDSDLVLTEDLADAYGQIGRQQDALDLYNNLAANVKDKDRLKTIQVKIVATLIDNGDMEAAKEAAEELKKVYPNDDWISTLFDSTSVNL